MPAVSGVYASAITPRREGPEIDLAATFELIDFLVASGVDGIVLLGSAGEFPHFDPGERTRLVSLAVKRSRLPVIAGAGHSTFDGAISLARDAAAAGAAAVLLPPPYYFRYSQDDIREFYLSAARELGTGTPLLLYNVPEFAPEVAPATAVELLAENLFAGIKDSSGNWDNIVQLAAAREHADFALISGSEAVFTLARSAGADGWISGVACAVPELLLALNRSILDGAAERTACLDARLKEFVAWMKQFPMPVAIRTAVGARGIKAGPHASPLGPQSQARLAGFRDWFSAWLPEVRRESVLPSS